MSLFGKLFEKNNSKTLRKSSSKSELASDVKEEHVTLIDSPNKEEVSETKKVLEQYEEIKVVDKKALRNEFLRLTDVILNIFNSKGALFALQVKRSYNGETFSCKVDYIAMIRNWGSHYGSKTIPNPINERECVITLNGTEHDSNMLRFRQRKGDEMYYDGIDKNITQDFNDRLKKTIEEIYKYEQTMFEEGPYLKYLRGFANSCSTK
jgi:hypothetical protein